MSIKYYHLAKEEEPPEEFCAVKDVGGEPSEYVFYVPESENAKLRKLVRKMYSVMDMADYVHEFDDPMHLMFVDAMRKLGIEVDA